jgi:hypothetical protein
LSLIRSKLPKKSCAINKCRPIEELDFNAQVFLKLISVRLDYYQPHWSFYETNQSSRFHDASSFR